MSNVRPQCEDGHLQPGDTDKTFLSAVTARQCPPTFSCDTGLHPPDLTPYITGIDSSRYLAGGAFGDVYKCLYTDGNSTPREVAVKALRFRSPPDESTEDRSVKMFRRELEIWKRLSHDNVVPFLGIAYGFGMSDTMSLVSLWMPNQTLHKFLAAHHNKLETVHRLQILLDISRGLHYLHSIPIVHGDLNSNNVLLDADYIARLADFGYASLAGNIPEALTYLQRSTARPGALRWAAPEQIDLDENYDRTTKSDVYSFGCIALQGGSLDTSINPILIPFQVLSGKQPWSEVREDASVVLRLHLGHKPARPKSRKIDDSHWDFIQCCWLPLEKRPTADIVLFSVQQFLDDYPPSGPLRDLFISPSYLDGGVQKRSSQLTRSLAHSWDTISCTLTTSVSTDDIVIFVLGPTGSGKSWFTKTATNSDLVKVSGDQDLKPFTSSIQAIRSELVDKAKSDSQWAKDIVLVDSPSFLTGYDHPYAPNEFQAWFHQTAYKPQSAGVIYMHRIETDPTLEPIEEHLQEFCNIPQIGDACLPQRLHAVVSYDKTSGIVSGFKIAKHKAKLHSQLTLLDRSRWNASMHEEMFQGESEVAWRAIKELLRTSQNLLES